MHMRRAVINFHEKLGSSQVGLVYQNKLRFKFVSFQAQDRQLTTPSAILFIIAERASFTSQPFTDFSD
jgi:hypothetical protein